MEKKLKKCPFCGNPNVRIVRYTADGTKLFRDRFAVLCDYETGGCGAESGHYLSGAEALTGWNTRRKRLAE